MGIDARRHNPSGSTGLGPVLQPGMEGMDGIGSEDMALDCLDMFRCLMIFRY